MSARQPILFYTGRTHGGNLVVTPCRYFEGHAVRSVRKHLVNNRVEVNMYQTFERSSPGSRVVDLSGIERRPSSSLALFICKLSSIYKRGVSKWRFAIWSASKVLSTEILWILAIFTQLQALSLTLLHGAVPWYLINSFPSVRYVAYVQGKAPWQ